jgi:predicted nuclease of predicted toxin-antitoxin system
VKFARSRGFYAVHVNEANLTGASDKHVARYAIENELILVTNNAVDFRRHYSRRKLHPGLVFLVCPVEEIFTDINQATLLNAVLDDLLDHDLVQEPVRIELLADGGDHLEWELTRHVYPNE